MKPGPLPIPPAPIASDLPIDKELLQQWSSSDNSNGTPAANQQRAPTYPKRHASFDSPREVPLPLSPGALFPSAYFSNFSSSGTTPPASTTTSRLPGQSPREPDFSNGYFLAQPSNLKPGQSSQSPASSGASSSSQSRFSSSSSGGGDSGGRLPVFEEDCDPPLESGSDWTSQTSPPSSSSETEGSPASGSIRPEGSGTGGLGSATDRTQTQTHSRTSSLQLDENTAALGSKTTSPMPRTTTIATPIFPYGPRPYSLPGPTASHSNSAKQPSRMSVQSPIAELSAAASQWPDHSSSSASLPLPTQVPFHTLPRAGPILGAGGVATLQDSLAAAAVARTHVVDKAARDAGETHAERVRQAHKSEVGETRRRPTPQEQMNYPYRYAPPIDPSSSSSNSSWSGSSSAGIGSRGQGTEVPAVATQRPPSPTHHASPSPFRAPQPPPRPSTSPSHLPPSSNLLRSQSQSPHQHSHSHSQSIHTFPHSSSQARGPAAFSPSSSIHPAPDPPIILAPTVSPSPFLSHAPPPPDSWIEVETTQTEYRLLVRLPGFRRDGITLATKRRRILHVVADCWEDGGGHFERRISFGYDADLVQVRAEFDGEMLRVSIPRRIPPIEIWSSAPARMV